jgi:hypothetical protein
VAAGQDADPRAIDCRDAAEVQHQIPAGFSQQAINSLRTN